MMVASAPENTNPVADQCEANGTPCLSSQTPWQAFFFGRNGDPKVGFKWTYHVFVGLEDLIATYTSMWQMRSRTNKHVGALWPNDADGNVFRPAFTEVLTQKNYTVVDPGAFPSGMEDYTSMISAFKKGGCGILTGRSRAARTSPTSGSKPTSKHTGRRSRPSRRRFCSHSR